MCSLEPLDGNISEFNDEIPSDNKKESEKWDRKYFDRFYDSMINEAPYVPGDICELIAATDIPWVNPELIKKGRKFAHDNFFAFMLAKTIALMCGFSVKSESVVLLRSGRFHKEDDAFFRVVSTGERIQSWYSDDILSVDSKAYRNCVIVRRMHSRAVKCTKPLPSMQELRPTPEKEILCQAIRKDLEFVDTDEAPYHLLTWTPDMEFSQFDMAMTQFGFIGVVYMFSGLIGISDMEGVDGFLHLWAVVGRLLGLEDRFNLALHPHPQLYHRFFINVVVASLKTTDMTVVTLQNALMTGLGKRLPCVSLKAMMYMTFKHGVPGFQGNHLYALMSIYDKICYAALITITGLMARSNIIRDGINWFFRAVVAAGNKMYLPHNREK